MENGAANGGYGPSELRRECQRLNAWFLADGQDATSIWRRLKAMQMERDILGRTVGEVLDEFDGGA